MQQDGKVSYMDLVWFLISDEDKKTQTKWADSRSTIYDHLCPLCCHSIFCQMLVWDNGQRS